MKTYYEWLEDLHNEVYEEVYEQFKEEKKMATQNEIADFIKRTMIFSYTSKDNQISYGQLLQVFRTKLTFYEYNIPFDTKDSLRAYMNKLFDNLEPHENYTLVSTAKGVFIARNRKEIIDCAERIRQHALGELARYAKLMKLPNDYQLLVDYNNLKIREVNRFEQQRLFDMDEELYEISKDREKNNV